MAKIRKMSTETIKLIILAFNWFECFKENRIFIENDPGSGMSFNIENK